MINTAREFFLSYSSAFNFGTFSTIVILVNPEPEFHLFTLFKVFETDVCDRNHFLHAVIQSVWSSFLNKIFF